MKNISFTLALGFLLIFSGCNRDDQKEFLPATEQAFSEVILSGSYYEIGRGAGFHFKHEIALVFEVRNEWFNSLKSAAKADSSALYQSLLDSAARYYPQYVEELKGMADGAGVAFEDIFILNTSAELDAARYITEEENPGCSTMFLVSEDGKFLIHSEDGHRVYAGNMFIAKVFPPSGVSFIALSYPGIMIGNGPGMNSKGIVQSTNFIGAVSWKPGIPRYFLNRAVLESISLDHAIQVSTHPSRAFAYRHNLGSFTSQKMIILEVTPWQYEIFEPSGNYCHTNHLLLSSTAPFPQDEEYVNKSSVSRLEALSGQLATKGEEAINYQDALSMISSHENAPYSPCRHPDGEIAGQTLGTAVFDFNKRIMSVYKGNPCESVPGNKVKTFIFKSEQD
jgi:predicted choloylglycine hydrolase